MDANRFDRLARTVGQQTSRRTMLKAAAGSALAAVGVGAVGRVARGQGVNSEARGFKGDACFADGDCEKGLFCDLDRDKCEYNNKCGGTKNQACKDSNDCCNNRNLICNDNDRCVRDKKK